MTPSTSTTDAFTPTRAWHTATYTNDRGACVEVAEGPATGIRDSKNPDRAALFFGAAEWGAFLAAVRDREV